jgi:ferritin-like metal-binding protein YciE
MKNQDLYHLFINELQDMYSAEELIIEALPHLIKSAFHEDLKEALTHHLKETQNQVKRLQKAFSLLDSPGKKKLCKGMEGILKEGKELISHQASSPVLDAVIIGGAQKVEHYEIASYGTLCSFAKHLNLKGDLIDLLKENLKEEEAADKKLTKIAEGSFFSTGVNEEAVETTLDARAEKGALNRQEKAPKLKHRT